MRLSRFIGLYAVVVAAASLGAAALVHERSSFDLGFMFGPAIESVASGRGLENAGRMPFIPWLLGAIAVGSPSVPLAMVLKNLVFGAPLAKIVWDGITDEDRRVRRATIVALAYLCTFPQLLRHTLALIPEEAYLTPLLAYAFHETLRAHAATRAATVIGVSVASAIATLTKSTMIVVGPCLALLVGVRTRSVRAFATILGAALSAALLWSAMNLHRSGTFTPMSSTDGYNFWKGNNERTLEFFPFRSLDALGDEAAQRRPDESEWGWSARCYRAGISFVREHPDQGAKILAWRFFQVFVAIVPEQPPMAENSRPWFRYVGIAHMLVFRLLLCFSLFWSLRAVWRGRGALRPRRGPRASVALASLPLESRERVDAEVAVAYLLFVAALVSPYLLAWGVERRLMPLVVPTVLFAAWALDRDGLRAQSYRS